MVYGDLVEAELMHFSLTDAKSHLTDLVRRAEAGDEIVLTRHGQPIARIVPIVPRLDRDARKAALEEIWETARARRLAGAFEGEDAARSQDFLYDEDGLPG